MFGTIRKHQTWLWAIIITLTVISFVYYFSPGQKMDLRGANSARDYVSPTSGKPVSLYGRPIGYEEFQKAYRETMVNHFFRTGRWPNTDDEAKQRTELDTIFHLLLIKRIEDLEVSISSRAVARLANEKLEALRRAMGEFSYTKFVSEILQPVGLNADDFQRFALHEAGIQQLVGVAAVHAKLVNPQEAEDLYRKDHEEISTEAAVFWGTNFMDRVTATPEDIRTYFTNRLAVYKTPARVQVSYVEFLATNYLAEADKQLARITNLDAQVNEIYYQRGGTNFFKDTNGVPLTEAAAKAKIKEDDRLNKGLIEARRRAADFGNALMDLQPPSLEGFEKLAADKKLPTHVTPPFDSGKGLEETDFPPEFRKAALNLTKDNPISIQPIVGEKAVYLIAVKTNIPPELPVFEKLQDKVTLDYKKDKALGLARSTGTNFCKFLTNGLAQRRTFSELCAEQKVKTVVIPPFSLSTQSLTNLDERIPLPYLQRFAFELKKGEVSEFLPSPEGGLIIYLRGRLPFDEAKVKADLPEFMINVRIARLNEAFNNWFRIQAEQARLVVPQRESVSSTPGRSPPRR